MKSSIRILGAAFGFLAFGQAFAQTPVMDGQRDASYTTLAVQNTQTGFGDNSLGQIGPANGSEIDNVAYYRDANNIYLFIGGNMENNGSTYQKVAMFFDTGAAGGYNKLPAELPDIDFNRLIRMGDDGSGNGLKFDAGFKAHHYLGLVCGGDPTAVYLNYAQIETITNGGTGNFVGGGTAGSDGTLQFGNNPFDARLTIDNSNVAGVPGGIGSDPGNGANVNTGYEIKIPLAMIGSPSGPVKICLFLHSDGFDFAANQFLNGMGGGDNLGDPRFIDLSVVPNDNYVTVPATSTTETLAPTSEALALGKGTGGDLSSWAADDNNIRTVCKFFIPNVNSPFIRANLGYVTTKTAPTAISFNVRVAVDAGGTQQITLNVQDKTNSAFVNTSVVAQNTAANTTYNGAVSGTLTNYVGGGGAMTGQIEVKAIGFQTSAFPCIGFDSANMVVTG